MPVGNSFDHLVGEREQIVGDFDAQRLGGLQVDDEFEFGRLKHRQVGGLGALENACRIYASLAIAVRPSGSFEAVSARGQGRHRFTQLAVPGVDSDAFPPDLPRKGGQPLQGARPFAFCLPSTAAGPGQQPLNIDF
jgi:hypothetical protein